jgi:hypothetical protein
MTLFLPHWLEQNCPNPTTVRRPISTVAEKSIWTDGHLGIELAQRDLIGVYPDFALCLNGFRIAS